MGKRLTVRTKVITLAVLAAGIGAAAATLASGTALRATEHVRAKPAVVKVFRVAKPAAVPHRHVFRPPVVRAHVARALPPTGLDLRAFVAVALALVAGGLLLRFAAADR
jgi:hypothetical protein